MNSCNESFYPNESDDSMYEKIFEIFNNNWNFIFIAYRAVLYAM